MVVVVVLGGLGMFSVRTLGEERSIAFDMLGTSALGRDAVGFLGSQLELESFVKLELELLVLVMLTECTGWTEGGVLDFSLALLAVVVWLLFPILEIVTSSLVGKLTWFCQPDLGPVDPLVEGLGLGSTLVTFTDGPTFVSLFGVDVLRDGRDFTGNAL